MRLPSSVRRKGLAVIASRRSSSTTACTPASAQKGLSMACSALTERSAGLIDVRKFERILLHRYQCQNGGRQVGPKDLGFGHWCSRRVCELCIKTIAFASSLGGHQRRLQMRKRHIHVPFDPLDPLSDSQQICCIESFAMPTCLRNLSFSLSVD